MALQHIGTTSMLNQELKKGSTESLILALVEDCPQHGYEIAKLIGEARGGIAAPRRFAVPATLPNEGMRLDQGAVGGRGRAAPPSLLQVGGIVTKKALRAARHMGRVLRRTQPHGAHHPKARGRLMSEHFNDWKSYVRDVRNGSN